MMGGMGGGMMGGMGGGMGGGMMGGMGGGFRSVAPTGLLSTTLDPRQVRHLPTPVVSLNGPDAEARPLVPAKGEKLRVLGIDQATDDARTQTALKRLAEVKAPRSVAQMALWYVTAGATWDEVGRLSQGWGNAHEIALARQFVARLDQAAAPAPAAMDKSSSHAAPFDPGLLYWEVKADGEAAREQAAGLRALWEKNPVLGLTAKEGVPAKPSAPALACRIHFTESAVDVTLTGSHPSGDDWISAGHFTIKASELTVGSGSKAPEQQASMDWRSPVATRSARRTGRRSFQA
jgi:hypothetical protein